MHALSSHICRRPSRGRKFSLQGTSASTFFLSIYALWLSASRTAIPEQPAWGTEAVIHYCLLNHYLKDMFMNLLLLFPSFNSFFLFHHCNIPYFNVPSFAVQPDVVGTWEGRVQVILAGFSLSLSSTSRPLRSGFFSLFCLNNKTHIINHATTTDIQTTDCFIMLVFVQVTTQILFKWCQIWYGLPLCLARRAWPVTIFPYRIDFKHYLT